MGFAERISSMAIRPEKKKWSGKSSRRKGHQFERDIAIEFRKLFPEARRHLEYHGKDANGVDLDHTGEFKIQCKRLRDYAPINRIKEIQCEREFGDIPILVTAGDNLEPMAVLPLTDLMMLIDEYLS